MCIIFGLSVTWPELESPLLGIKMIYWDFFLVREWVGWWCWGTFW